MEFIILREEGRFEDTMTEGEACCILGSFEGLFRRLNIWSSLETGICITSSASGWRFSIGEHACQDWSLSS